MKFIEVINLLEGDKIPEMFLILVNRLFRPIRLIVCLILMTSAVEGCGYESCPATKAGLINVHLVPHTHDDVGWLKTVDQYYYGSRKVFKVIDLYLQSVLLLFKKEF